MKKQNDNHEPVDPFVIDPARLDEYLLTQTRLLRAAALRAADANEDHERAKAAKDIKEARLKETEARVNLDLRENPEQMGAVGQVREDTYKQATILDPRRLQAQEEVEIAQEEIIKAKKVLDVAKAEVSAFEDRKWSIKLLADLWTMRYYEIQLSEATSEGVAAAAARTKTPEVREARAGRSTRPKRG